VERFRASLAAIFANMDVAGQVGAETAGREETGRRDPTDPDGALP